MTGTLPDGEARDATRRSGRRLACVVLNPSKQQATKGVCAFITRELRAAGYSGPLWLETTPSETGATQALMAVASGADLVVAVGGDGTARAVAAGVSRTGVDLAIVPLGTANLAARNFDLPIGDLRRLLRVAAHGQGRSADLAWVSTKPLERESAEQVLTPPPGGWAKPTLGREHSCLVVAGIGFDANLVASTRPALKARIAWGAYALAALSNLGSPRMDLELSLDESVLVAKTETGRGSTGVGDGGGPGDSAAETGDAGRPRRRARGAAAARPRSGAGANSPPARDDPDQGGAGAPKRRTERLTARTLLVANGGRLPGGITLLPGARPDDGVLDVAAIDTVAGLVGWGSLARQVLAPWPASYANPARATGRVVQLRGSDVLARLSAPALVEVDGELLPPTRDVHVRLDAGALRIRRP